MYQHFLRHHLGLDKTRWQAWLLRREQRRATGAVPPAWESEADFEREKNAVCEELEKELEIEIMEYRRLQKIRELQQEREVLFVEQSNLSHSVSSLPPQPSNRGKPFSPFPQPIPTQPDSLLISPETDLNIPSRKRKSASARTVNVIIYDRPSEARTPKGKDSQSSNETDSPETIKPEVKVNPASNFEPPSVVSGKSISRV